MKKDQLVVRHNNLIEASYSTNLVQQRLLYWMLAQIRPTDRQLQTYRITIKEMQRYLGIQSKSIYKDIQNAAEGMVGSVVRVKDIDRDKTLIASLVSSVEYSHGKGYIDISLDPKLRPYLLNLQDSYTRALLSELSTIGSVYASRIFDLLIQYRKIGKRKCTVEDLRSILNLGEKYTLYSNFKNRVIVPAVKEINRSTNLEVKWVEIKKGRAVHAIEFTFHEIVHPTDVPSNDAPLSQTGLVDRIMSHGLSRRVAQGFVEKYANSDVDRILEALKQVEEGVRTGKVKNPGGWLRRAIEEDWREQRSLFVRSLEEEKQRASEHIERQKVRDASLHEIDEKIRIQEDRYLTARMDFVKAIVDELSEVEYERCLSIILDKFGSDPRVGLWNSTSKRKDLTSKTILPLVEQMISEEFDQDFLDLESYLESEGLTSVEDLRSQREQYL